MKKLVLIGIVIVLTFAMAGFGFAATTSKTIDSATTVMFGSNQSFKTSTGVTLKHTGDPTTYAASSQHGQAKSTNGGRQFGTVYNSPSIPWAAAIDTAGPTAPASATALANLTWTY